MCTLTCAMTLTPGMLAHELCEVGLLLLLLLSSFFVLGPVLFHGSPFSSERKPLECQPFSSAPWWKVCKEPCSYFLHPPWALSETQHSCYFPAVLALAPAHCLATSLSSGLG